MPGRILSVSYDPALLNTRQLVLQEQGYEVVSSLDLSDALAHCKSGNFDLFVIGHSIPTAEKLDLIKTFRLASPAPVLALLRVGEPVLQEADFHVNPAEPEELLRVVSKIFQSPKTADTSR